MTAPDFPYDFVEVEWLDAKSDDEWHLLDHEFELPQAVSRGWLIQDQTDFYVLAAGRVWEVSDWYAGPWDIIPKGMVTKLTVLTPKGYDGK